MQLKINELREKLNKKLQVENIDSEEILKISQELDQLILEYYNINNPNEKKNK